MRKNAPHKTFALQENIQIEVAASAFFSTFSGGGKSLLNINLSHGAKVPQRRIWVANWLAVSFFASALRQIERGDNIGRWKKVANKQGKYNM